MRVLLDSNILLRLAQLTHPMHGTARAAVSALQQGGATLHTVPQNFYEFWVVATRPMAVNGLGLSVPQVLAEVARLTALFSFLPSTPAVYPEWLRLVGTLNVAGRTAHDARLVAAMAVHGITQLLTFNTPHFARYPGITALEPAAGAAPPGTPVP
jgi:predicted nucleic acid-binding protein